LKGCGDWKAKSTVIQVNDSSCYGKCRVPKRPGKSEWSYSGNSLVGNQKDTQEVIGRCERQIGVCVERGLRFNKYSWLYRYNIPITYHKDSGTNWITHVST
jgi:hypothetical protein